MVCTKCAGSSTIVDFTSPGSPLGKSVVAPGNDFWVFS
jgi:hypothetical protein